MAPTAAEIINQAESYRVSVHGGIASLEARLPNGWVACVKGPVSPGGGAGVADDEYVDFHTSWYLKDVEVTYWDPSF